MGSTGRWTAWTAFHFINLESGHCVRIRIRIYTNTRIVHKCMCTFRYTVQHAGPMARVRDGGRRIGRGALRRRRSERIVAS
eukprot:COSAG02_NODE_75_length_41389_cov_106.665762_25_plen_81_part_00